MMSTRRVDGRMLQECSQGQIVRIVGRSDPGNMSLLLAADNTPVHVKRVHDFPYPSTFVEVIARVTGPASVDELTYVPFGEDFDMDTYAAALPLISGKFTTLFNA